MEKRYQRAILTAILIIYAMIMILGAIMPNPQDIPVFADHSAYFHLFGFMILTVMIFRTLDLYNLRHFKLWSLIFIVIFTIGTESLQLLVKTRTFSLADMIFDILGAIIGWQIYSLLYAKKKRNAHH